MAEPFGKALVFVRPERDRGPILYASGGLLAELHDGGGSWNIEDHDVPTPKDMGLQIFEGWIEHTIGPDPDVRWSGEWRQMTHWELMRVRFGLSPLDNTEVSHAR